MKSIKVCEYLRSRSYHDDLILQDQASGERSQDQWSSGIFEPTESLHIRALLHSHKKQTNMYVERTGAVGSTSDFGPRGPWFDPRLKRRLLWP